MTGENERALYFAVGYAQTHDRAFQMDLQRRLMRGELSVIVGSSNTSTPTVGGSARTRGRRYWCVRFEKPPRTRFLGYAALPTDGSRETVSNYAVENPTGSSWRMVVSMDGHSSGVLPGGNSGSYFSEHYNDQLRMWANGEYQPMTRNIRGTTAFTFEKKEKTR